MAGPVAAEKAGLRPPPSAAGGLDSGGQPSRRYRFDDLDRPDALPGLKTAPLMRRSWQPFTTQTGRRRDACSKFGCALK
jgi:hypothetical protein